MKEYILCSAVWYKELELKKDVPFTSFLPKNLEKGVVFCGFRHAQCIYTKVAITGLRDAESGDSVQGFLTSLNRFVDREEGAKIHILNGGVLKYSNKELYSEDLY